MPRTALTVLDLPRDGANLSTESSDAVNGNSFAMTSGQTILASFFSATGGTVTINVPAKVDTNLQVPDRVLTLTAGVVKLWICTNPTVYIQSDGTVWVDTSTTLSVAIYKVG